MSMNAEIFLPHIKEKHGTTTVKDYCIAMSNDRVWRTHFEILALAYKHQYTYFHVKIQTSIDGYVTSLCHLQAAFNVTMIKHLRNYFTWTNPKLVVYCQLLPSLRGKIPVAVWSHLEGFIESINSYICLEYSRYYSLFSLSD